MLPKAFISALIPSLIGACLLTGCSPFARFYQPAANSHGPAVSPQTAPSFKWSRDPAADSEQLSRQGYVLIGTSSFVGATFTYDLFYKDQAVTQGMKLGAALVLLQADYNNAVSDGCCVRVFASYWAHGSSRVGSATGSGE
jgi:hypothetical protein